MFEYYVYLLRFVELTALSYLLLIAAYTFGWFKLRKIAFPVEKTSTSITIIVALRNEAATVVTLIKHLANQQKMSSVVEIILVDDHSEDETISLITSQLPHYPETNFQLIQAEKKGKKEAIVQALKMASGQLILVTDADCRPGPLWAATMTSTYETTQAKLLLGPVQIETNNRLFEKFQALEFISLMGSTAGSAAISWPSMANGANMAFEKQAFFTVEKLRRDATLASGDDVFLMTAIKQHFGSKAIQFVAAETAIIPTMASPDLKSFLHQRTRWVSKSSGYTQASILVPAWIVLIFNLLLVIMSIISIFIPWMLLIAMLFFSLKAMIDLPLLHSVTTFMRQRHLLKYFIPLTIVYPFYVVIVALAGVFGVVHWKGRKVH